MNHSQNAQLVNTRCIADASANITTLNSPASLARHETECTSDYDRRRRYHPPQ